MEGHRFGPNGARIERLVERASRLTEAEALDLLGDELRLQRGPAFSAALRDVVYAAHETGRQRELERAEQAARDAVTVFGPTSRGRAVGGYVGRAAEALVVADRIRPSTLDLLLGSWLRTAGQP